MFQDSSSAGCKAAPYFVASFVECSNIITQDEQLDVVLRYWDTTEATVKTRYYSSEFLGHTRAEDLSEKFKQSMSHLEQKKMLQLSMGGPSVSWKVFRLLSESRESNGYPSLVNTGSCGLYVIHGSFQMGAKESGWDIEVLLKALWNIFRDSPARRANYERVADSVVFPLKFCSHRRVED